MGVSKNFKKEFQSRDEKFKNVCNDKVERRQIQTPSLFELDFVTELLSVTRYRDNVNLTYQEFISSQSDDRRRTTDH